MEGSGEAAELDRRVRLFVYRCFVDDGRPPIPAEIAARLSVSVADAEGSLRRLADAHVLVLAPGTPYVWMANPFSAIPTPFAVRARRRAWWGNCIWDALGILATLRSDGAVSSWCPDCGEPVGLDVHGGELVPPGDQVAHFAVPAAHWWDDIGST